MQIWIRIPITIDQNLTYKSLSNDWEIPSEKYVLLSDKNIMHLYPLLQYCITGYTANTHDKQILNFLESIDGLAAEVEGNEELHPALELRLQNGNPQPDIYRIDIRRLQEDERALSMLAGVLQELYFDKDCRSEFSRVHRINNPLTKIPLGIADMERYDWVYREDPQPLAGLRHQDIIHTQRL